MSEYRNVEEQLSGDEHPADAGFRDRLQGRESAYDLMQCADSPQAEDYRKGWNVVAGAIAPIDQPVSRAVQISDELSQMFDEAAARCNLTPDQLLRAAMDLECVKTFGRGPELKDGKLVWEPPTDQQKNPALE